MNSFRFTRFVLFAVFCWALGAGAPCATLAASDAAKEVEALTKDLSSDNATIRANATLSLSLYGEQAQGALNILLKGLKDENPGVRSNSAFALGAMGRGGLKAAPDLILLLQDPDAMVRCSAMLALNLLAPMMKDKELAGLVEALIPFLQDPDPFARRTAVLTLAACNGKGAAAGAELVEMMGDEDIGVRRAVVMALGKIKPPRDEEGLAAAMLQTLFQALEDEDSRVRWTTAEVLAEAGERLSEDADLEQCLVALLERLKDKDGRVRQAVVYSLGRLGPVVLDRMRIQEESAGQTQVTGGEENATVSDDGREQASDAVPQEAETPAWRVLLEEAVTGLIKALSDGNSFVRWRAADALALIGPEAGDVESAISVLAKGLGNKNVLVRISFARALGVLLSEEGGQALSGARSGEAGVEPGRQVPAVSGEATHPAVSVLAGLLEDEVPLVREAAAWSLVRLKPGSFESLSPELRQRMPEVEKDYQEKGFHVWPK